MTPTKPIKVVWLCNFSNAVIREKLSFSTGFLDFFFRKVTNSNTSIHLSDFGQWITNGIDEIKRYNDVELHVISPHYRLKGKTQEFNIEGVYYHFYSDESYSLRWKIFSRCGLKKKPVFKRNCRLLSCLVDKVDPDLFHLIGAENINYSLFTLTYTKKVPFIVQLQTLVNDPKVYLSLPGNNGAYIKSVETAILKKANYIFTSIPSYAAIIRRVISDNAIIMANKLAVGVTIDKKVNEKEFDFVYYSANISKAADIAIRAFAITKKLYPNITLDIVGYYSSEYKLYLDDIINENELSHSVLFEGHLPTHEDVLQQVKKARFALLPLRPDVLPSTIREAMSVGCPVVTTITQGTMELNKDRLSALLSKPESPESLADNMCRLLADPSLSMELRNNSFITVREMYDNYKIIRQLLDSYYSCLDHYYNHIPIPQRVLI
jgi:glycosyltransferase involved in cell wall biosynthesis